MTEAASLNFGPAWLRDSFTSNTAGEGPPGSGSGGGGTINHGHQQNNSGWDIASSRSSHGGGHAGGRSVGGQPQANPQSNFQMNLHVEGQHSSGTSAMLSAMKLAEFRYGKEEMLGLYPVGLVQQDNTTNSSVAATLMLDEDILEAMETTSLLVPDRRALPPLNLMGAVSEDEQRAWSRGANSDTSLRLYSKQKDMSRVIEDGIAGRGGPSLRGDHRGGLPERGRGRGVGRGGGLNSGPFFDRHRSDDPLLDDPGIGGRGSNGGRGVGSSDMGSGDGVRPFGGGRGSRAFDRSLSTGGGGSWYADRSASNGPASAGIIGPGGPAEDGTNNGSMSPRKGYTRAPFDDWRKPPTNDREEDGEGGGWRSSGTGPSGRRWNAPATSGSGGPPQGWRAPDDGYRGGGKYERDFVNGGGGRWREDGPTDSYFSRSRGGFSSGSRGSFSSNSFSRQRSRQDSDIPEWALDDDAPGGSAGGTFDSSGKFRAPSSESPPPLQSSRDNTSPKSSPTTSRRGFGNKNDRKSGEDQDRLDSPYNDRNSEESSQHNKEFSEENLVTNNNDSERPEGVRGRGRGRQRHELRLLHGQMDQNSSKKHTNEKEHRYAMDDMEDEERFEDEEVDVDDLPPDVRKTTLQQRQQQKQREEEEAKGTNINNKGENHLPMQEENRFQEQLKQSQPQVMSHEMDNALVDSLVDSLINDDDEDERDPASIMPKLGASEQPPSISSPVASVPSSIVNPDQMRQQSNQDNGLLGSGGDPATRHLSGQHPQQQEETVWFYLDPQGNRQGPFSNSDMLDWFNAGYFPTELMLRRSIDKRFIQLIEMTKLYERVPFAPGPWPNIPPPLEDVEELEKQKQEAEKRKLEQQNALFQQLQQQALLQQQLQLQQQRLFAIQQQHQGPDKAAIEQALAAQAAATAQAIQQQQQLMQKMMQNMNIFNQQQQQQQQPNNQLQQQILKEQLHSESASPGLGAPGSHQNNEPEHQPFQRQQRHPSTSQPDHQPSSQQSGLGGFGLGLSSPNEMHQRSPNQQQQVKQSPTSIGGVIGQSSLGSDASSNIGGYDPIKSLLNQLQQSDQTPSSQAHQSLTSNDSRNGRHAEDKMESLQRTLNNETPATDSPHMGRSIWDMPVATPTTPNPSISREQQEQQLLHNQQQQQLLLQQQQQEAEKMNHQGWDQVRAGLMEENANQQQQQGWPSHPHSLQPQQESSQPQQQQHDQQQSNAHQDFENKAGGKDVEDNNDARNISTIDSFRTETASSDNNDLLNKNNNSSSSTSKPKESKKDKKEKGNKKDNNKKNNNEKSSNQTYQDADPGHYIPGMEGTVKPEQPITATKTLAEEQQERAQADALYRLQLEQQQMLERERALAEEKAAKQRQESLQSAAKLAPWAKKTQTGMNVNNEHSGGMMSGGFHHQTSQDESNLSLAEIQRLEEERERERKIQKEMEEQQMRELRMKQEQEEQLRRQQGKGMNWATTAAAGINNGPSGGKSLAEIQAEEEEQERRRQERERQQKKERQKEMGLAQASVWGSASSNLSWASKAATVGTPPSNNPNPALSTPQNKPKQAHPGSSSLVTSSPAPWSSAVNSNSNASGGGFWDDAAPPPGLNNSNSSTPAQSNKNKKKTNNKEAQKNNMKTAKEDAKVAQIFRENSAKNTPRQNEFEAWCSSALSNLNAQVDIPTFMAFLKDIESPYEVNDYVKNYIGEGKGPKNFAKEYLERRSKYKNSLKGNNQNFEDELLTPAQAINPNRESENDGWINAGNNGGGGSGVGSSQHNSAGGKSKKKGKGAGKGSSKFGDASHLLGFSVASDRVNAGDIDMPQ